MAPEFGTPIHQLPLIPANVLKKHCVHEPLDTRFRSAARLLQALWREDQDLPIGSYVNEDGKHRKLGSRISEAAGRAGGNFLTPEIAHTARREAAYREIGALIYADRLATNLLSSMPLAFNLLAPWGRSLERASGYLIELLPAFTGAARQLLFEHSPGRGNPKFTADYTAFDALIRYSDGQGRNGFVAFEIKYSESMREPMPELKPRHAELSESSGLFTEPAAAALRANPLQQLWREHLLAQSMIDNGLYDEGYFVTIAPALNYHVQDAAAAYQIHLCPPADNKVRFVNVTLEDVIEVIRLSDPAHADALHHRYCNFWLVDGALELNAPTFGPARPRTRQRRKPRTQADGPTVT
jgi:PD-(D/E)XK nuclease superfamily protein